MSESYVLVPYSDFVRSRVKWLGSVQENLMHAAVGLMGEAVELHWASNTEHRQEELGDLEFYLEHAYQAIAELQNNEDPFAQRSAHTMADCDHLLSWGCATFLDYAKKGWVYQKDLEAMPLRACLHMISDLLDQQAEMWGWKRTDLQLDNQIKLLKRYPTGYTDAAAQARADKAPGE